MKYRIATNSYPYFIIVCDNFTSEKEAYDYAHKLQDIWCFGRHGWHVESYEDQK